MKKVLVMVGVMLFSASAFALNAEAQADKTCAEQKAKLEQLFDSQSQDSHIVQYILINLADPLEYQKPTDEEFTPLAQCYMQVRVKGQPLVDFVRANADIFRQKSPLEHRSLKVFDEMQAELNEFADRVERVAEQAELNRVIALGNESYVVQHVLSNLIDPMKKMTDEQAAPKAKVYALLKVNGISLAEFVRNHANDYTMDVEIDMDHFADRIERLAK